MNQADMLGDWESTMVPNYGAPELCITTGQGAHLTTDDGRTFVDLASGVAVNALGHGHPAIVQAVQDQIARLGHVSNLYQHPPGLELAARLRRLSGMRCLFVNSGTEANEAAIKLVRKARDGVIIAFEGSFHGRTLGSLALTGQPQYHAGFGPLPGGIIHVPWNDPAQLEAAFDEHKVAGVFFEPIQGEGGVRPMSQDMADTLQRLIQEHDAILVADEVQTGMGRTGRWFAHQMLDLRPHVITLAKGRGGGMPIGACLIHDDLADVLGPGTHGCTFGGHPVSAAAANATIDAVAELLERARDLGDLALERLSQAGIQARGVGLLLGVPCDDPKAVVQRLQARGFLATVAGPSTVRLAPPLVIDEDDWMRGVDAVIASR